MNDIVFYTCFFGSDYNWANLIPNCPSKQFPCFYFTNNINTYSRLQGTGWITVFVDIPIKEDNTESSFDAKRLKACPHHYEMLNEHKYSCYFDSKHNVDVVKIEGLVEILEQNDKLSIMIPKHPSNFHLIWEEYNLAITIDKYKAEKDKYFKYIHKQLDNNFSDTVETHYTTQFILRKNNEVSQELNELWYSHIQECGIMCQLSFFFIQQIFKENICSLNYQECYNYCF